MAFFYVVEGGAVLLYKNGVYRQAKLFKRVGHQEFYADYAGGFVTLHQRPMTSCPKIGWREVVAPKVETDKTGKLVML